MAVSSFMFVGIDRDAKSSRGPGTVNASLLGTGGQVHKPLMEPGNNEFTHSSWFARCCSCGKLLFISGDSAIMSRLLEARQ